MIPAKKSFLYLSIVQVICIGIFLITIFVESFREFLKPLFFGPFVFLIISGVFILVLMKKNKLEKRLRGFLLLSAYSSILLLPFIFLHNILESLAENFSGFIKSLLEFSGASFFILSTIILPILLLVGSIVSIWIICKKEIRRN
jgi:hypothetical protein